MDGDNGLNMRNWGYYEATTPFKNHLGLQLMSSMPEKQTLLGACNAAAPFHHRYTGMPQQAYPMEYMRDAWSGHNHRDRVMNMNINMIPTNHNYSVAPETSSAHQMQMVEAQPQSTELSEEETPTEEEPPVEKVNGTGKKRGKGPKVPKAPKAKKPKRGPREPKDENASSVQRARTVKRSAEIVINGIDMDLSSIPIPVCSCTGPPQQCYRWGSGGWQSACCTTGISIHPLPMSTKRRGARIAGRKMSIGAFKKVLEKLAAEGYNFSNPIDLKTYWARHGTNKFVTISEESENYPGLLDVGTTADGQNTLELGLPQSLATLKFGVEDLRSIILKGGSVFTLAKIYQLLARKLSGKVLVEAANYQIKKELMKKGGQLAIINLESRAALLAAKQGFLGAASKYLGFRSMLTFLGPVLWGTFLADVVIQMLGTDYARILRTIYALAQIRVLRTYKLPSDVTDE